MAKPASMTSTPSSASASAMPQLLLEVIEKPGDCSRRAAWCRKKMMRSSSSVPKLGWVMAMVGSFVDQRGRAGRPGSPWSKSPAGQPGVRPRGG